MKDGTGEISDESRMGAAALPIDDGVVSGDVLHNEDIELFDVSVELFDMSVELPDVSVELSEEVERQRDRRSSSFSFFEAKELWKTCGCWLQTAKNVSLKPRMD